MMDRSKLSFVVLTAFVFLFSIVCLGISESYSMPESYSYLWDIKFNSAEVINNTSFEYNDIKLNEYSTTLNNLGFVFDNNEDSITYRIIVKNSGTNNAKLGYFNIGEPVCTNDQVCNELEYSLTYESGEKVNRGDMFNSNTGTAVLLTIKHVGSSIVEPVTIEKINFVMNFIEG